MGVHVLLVRPFVHCDPERMDKTRSFPLNAWYVAAWSRDIEHALFPRTICGKKIVLYRTSEGKVAALEDACWHRLVPLSKGRLDGDQVVCGYHGLVFNAAGRCTHMPSQETINPSACVRSFPIVERYSFVWIFMGDPALADPALIPDMHWVDDPAWAGEGRMTPLACNYRLVVDNLMDLTHETFVHATSIGNRAVAEAPFEVRHGDRTAQVERWMLNIDPPPFWRFQLGQKIKSDGKVDRWQYINYEAPAAICLDVGVALAGSGAPQGDRSQGVNVAGLPFHHPGDRAHLLLLLGGAAEFQSRRSGAHGRDARQECAIVAEDQVVLTAQQIAMEENPDAVFYNLNIDGGAMWARRRARKDDGRRAAAGPARRGVAACDMPRPGPMPGCGRCAISPRASASSRLCRTAMCPRAIRSARTSMSRCRCRASRHAVLFAHRRGWLLPHRGQARSGGPWRLGLYVVAQARGAASHLQSGDEFPGRLRAA